MKASMQMNKQQI